MASTRFRKFLRVKINTCLLFSFFLIPSFIQAQIENVIVETYYVTDSTDVADATGGILEAGSVTYRVYVDLKPGCKIKKIYGDANHALIFSSTTDFFNNKLDGQTFGKDFSKNRLQENSVALDTWLTLGQTTRVASKTYFGVLKNQDRDGSFIGGVNNDIGLLTNNDPSAGPPLTSSDGMDTMMKVPASWGNYGIVTAGQDSTIFGSLVRSSQFTSYNAFLQNSGVGGVFPDSNQVLVAQLTTKGTLSFQINLEIDEPGVQSVKYVAKLASGDTLSSTFKQSRFLKYPPDPPVCGCSDSRYLEYRAGLECSNSDSCKNRIVLGCMDPMACNYDPDANFNLPELCCYPGKCNDRNIEVVCPSLTVSEKVFSIYPNPAKDKLTLEMMTNEKTECRYVVYNTFGRIVLEKNLGEVTGSINQELDLSKLENGLYFFRLFTGTVSEGKLFIKN